MQSSIRPFQTQDIPDLLNILKNLIPEYFAPEEYADYQQYLHNSIEYYFCVEIENRIIGGGGINIQSAIQTVCLSWDVIAPDVQAQGIGKALVLHRLHFIQTHFPHYRIQVRTSQMAAAFYAKCGFTTHTIEKNYWADGFDLHDMYLQ